MRTKRLTHTPFDREKRFLLEHLAIDVYIKPRHVTTCKHVTTRLTTIRFKMFACDYVEIIKEADY